MSIQFRFVLPAVAGLILLGLFTYALAASIQSRGVEDEIIRRNEVMLAAVDREVAVAARHSLELASLVSAAGPVREAYEEAHEGVLDDPHDPHVEAARAKLRDRLAPQLTAFEQNMGGAALQLHFHLPPARSLLRAWTAKDDPFGQRWLGVSDDLSQFRATVVDVNRTGKAVQGIELGRAGFVIRGVAPIRGSGGAVLGSVEALTSFDSVLSGHLDIAGRKYGLLMNDSGLGVTSSLRDPSEHPLVPSREHQYVLVTTGQSKDVLDLTPWSLLDDARDQTIHHWAKPFMVSLHPVRDFRGAQIGVLVMATDHAQLLAEEASFRAYLAAATVTSVILVGAALLVLSRKVRTRITATTDRLRDLAEGPGDLDSRLQIGGRDEMAEFARQFNALMDRLQASFAGVARNMRRVLELVPPSGEPSVTPVHRAKTLSEATAQTDEIVERVAKAIDAWKQAEQARVLLATIVESSDDAIYGTDLEGKILTWNRGAEKLYGRPADDAIGLEISVLWPKDWDIGVRVMLDGVRRGEAQRQCETSRVRMSGEEFPVSIAVSPLRDQFGAVVGAAVIERDITQRVLAEEAAAEQRQQLVQADKLASLGTLVAGVAHEISNPNSFIMLNAPVLRDIWNELVPHLRAYRSEHGAFDVGAMPFDACQAWVPTLLSDIEKGAERINGIVTSLKDYARQDPPTMNEEVDVSDVVRSSMTLTRSRLDKATRSLSVDLPDGLPPVRGSFQRIEQVVVNLLLNACDALPSPHRAVRVATRLSAAHAGQVEILVQDEGTGMDARTLARIRDPFFTTKRNSGGTGLGVSISDGIVHEHGGSLHFQTAEGQGTSAIVSLPACRPNSRKSSS